MLSGRLSAIRFQAGIGNTASGTSPRADVPPPGCVATPGYRCSSAGWRSPRRNVQASELPASRALDEPVWLLFCLPREFPT